MDLLVGADPELFLTDATGKFVSAHGLFPGTKEKPWAVAHGAVQVDGMAAEFNIEPAANVTDFKMNIAVVMHELRSLIPDDMICKIVPVAHFDEETMARTPEEAKRLGCDPDYNAYTGLVNNPPVQHKTMRTAAGHIHLGYTAGQEVLAPVHFEAVRIVIKQMDFWLGLPSVIYDEDRERKEMYGKAGAFRPKPYGCEYRTLSNAWLRCEDTIELVFRNAEAGFDMLANHGIFLGDSYGEVAEDIINTNNAEEAIRLCKEIGIPFGR